MAKNAITLEQAQEWATTWRENPEHVIKAFLILQLDFVQLIAERDVQDVRAYIGTDENGNQKLMLVGVNSNGQDLINDTNNQNIYDFTTTCPEFCDTESPLFTLK
jgi:hypothetical protein